MRRRLLLELFWTLILSSNAAQSWWFSYLLYTFNSNYTFRSLERNTATLPSWNDSHRSSSSRSASGSRWGRKGRRAAAPQVKWRETRRVWSWASLLPSRSTGAAVGAPRAVPAAPQRTDPYLTGPDWTGEVGKRRRRAPTIPIPTGSAGRLEPGSRPFSERDRAPHVAVPPWSLTKMGSARSRGGCCNKSGTGGWNCQGGRRGGTGERWRRLCVMESGEKS